MALKRQNPAKIPDANDHMNEGIASDHKKGCPAAIQEVWRKKKLHTKELRILRLNNKKSFFWV